MGNVHEGMIYKPVKVCSARKASSRTFAQATEGTPQADWEPSVRWPTLGLHILCTNAAVVVAGGLTGVAMAAVGKASLHTSQTAYAILEHLRNGGVSPAPSIEAAGISLPIDPPSVGWTTKTIKGRRGSVNLTVDEYGFINAKTSFGTKQFRTEEEAVAYFA